MLSVLDCSVVRTSWTDVTSPRVSIGLPKERAPIEREKAKNERTREKSIANKECVEGASDGSDMR